MLSLKFPSLSLNIKSLCVLCQFEDIFSGKQITHFHVSEKKKLKGVSG